MHHALSVKILLLNLISVQKIVELCLYKQYLYDNLNSEFIDPLAHIHKVPNIITRAAQIND